MKKIFKILILFVFIFVILFFVVGRLNKQSEEPSLDMKSEETNRIIVEDEDYIVYETDTKVYVMDTNKEKSTEIFSKDEYTFQKLVDGTIYYTVNPNFGDTTLTLKSMNTSGTQNKVIKIFSLEKIEIEDESSVPEVIQFDVDDDNFYISYGYYAEKTEKIKDSEILIFSKSSIEKELVLEGYSKFEFYDKDNKKYIIVNSEEDGKEGKTIDVESYEEIKLEE